MSTVEAGESPAHTSGGLSVGGAREAPSTKFISDSFFRRFFGKPWWAIVLWMIFLCMLLLLTLLLFRFLSGWLSREMTWESFERFVTSPFATAVGAIGAAFIAGTAVVLTLNQNKNVEASKTWWETFEWAAERARPLKKENEALPYGTALDILSPLMDDDFGGRLLGRRARKSWVLRKRACGSIIKLLNEPYEIPNSEGRTNAPTAELTAEPAPEATTETAPEPTTELSSEPPRKHQGPSRAFLRDRDLESVQNFIVAHSGSQSARELSSTHYELLLLNHLARLLPKDDHIRIVRNAQLRDFSRYKDIGRTEVDALLMRGSQAVILEIKRNTRMARSDFMQVLEKEAIRAKNVWYKTKIPTLLVTDYPIPDTQLGLLGHGFARPYFWVSRWTGETRETANLAKTISDLFAHNGNATA